ncbi:MAG: hypothetical protein DLM58_22020 [Pseudonocardiales bacterium]|nr:MAG: hypothetical protein DLM58_22020 [Pseudonocardiales bacterium]
MPLHTAVDNSVLRRYALRCVPVAFGAAVIIAISHAIPRLAGLAAVDWPGSSRTRAGGDPGLAGGARPGDRLKMLGQIGANRLYFGINDRSPVRRSSE